MIIGIDRKSVWIGHAFRIIAPHLRRSGLSDCAQQRATPWLPRNRLEHLDLMTLSALRDVDVSIAIERQVLRVFQVRNEHFRRR